MWFIILQCGEPKWLFIASSVNFLVLEFPDLTSTEVKKLSFDFRFPELVAENATSFILFSTSKGYENFAHYNIKTDKLWIIEEERSMFRTTNIRMNESIIILYKETRNNKGIMKVYSIENRRKIYNQDMIDLIDFVLDSRSNTKTVIVFYKDKCLINFDIDFD